ncbi:MAG: hypothetical protein RBT25_09055 [Lentisphaeria bacterium]|nr:hypothetical protein [Lentisphaeria bacterium]
MPALRPRYIRSMRPIDMSDASDRYVRYVRCVRFIRQIATPDPAMSATLGYIRLPLRDTKWTDSQEKN